jgi:hypothetical protein
LTLTGFCRNDRKTCNLFAAGKSLLGEGLSEFGGSDFTTLRKLFSGEIMTLGLNKLRVSVAALLLVTGLAVAPAFSAGKAQTFNGQVSDAMCGAKHEMEGSAAQCTRACLQHGSKYALIVGDKVYTLDGADKKALEQLDKLAGEKASVTGTADGSTIQVASVSPGK